MNLRLAAALAGLYAVIAPAGAQEFTGITMRELTGVFKDAGYDVAAMTSYDTRRIGDTSMWLTECDPNGRCNEIQFSRTYSAVSPTLDAVNDWNWSYKIPEASVSTRGNLHLEMWLTTRGSTPLSIIDSFKWFEGAASNDYWLPWTGEPVS